MKKLKYIFASAFAVATLCLTVVSAYGETIKVGLEKNYKNVAELTVTHKGMSVGIGDSTKTYKLTGTYTIKPVTGNYYKTGEIYDSYEKVYKRLPAYTGYQCIPALTENGWTIYVRTDGKALNKPKGDTGSYCVGFAYNGVYKFVVDGTSPARVKGSDGMIDLGESTYRGEIECLRKGSTLTAVNVVDDEAYLYGVINSEMPSSWSLEAQKAQAVAARTYMERCKGTKHSTDYDLCDTVHCQAYNGVANETEIGIQAVNETKNLCIYYDDKLIEAVYFSSDGGATFDGEEVWGGETEYLKGKTDKYEKEYLEWTREFTYSQLTDMCASRGYNIGNVIRVVAEYNDRDLVSSLTFLGSQGSKTITNDEVRTAFSSAGGSLYSRNFQVIVGAAKSDDEAEENENTVGTPGVVTFIGKGNGHSVGMSQYGAKAMAEEGFDFEDILKFYYTGVEIK